MTKPWGNRVANPNAPTVSDRLQPQSVEAEQMVLGAMLQSAEAVGKVLEFLRAENFYRDSHRQIFLAVIALFERNEPIDLTTVREELFKQHQLEAVGGEYYLASLVADVTSPANATAYAKIVLEKALFRQLIATATEVIEDSYEATSDAQSVIDRAESKIFSLAERRLQKGFVHIEVPLKETFSVIEKAHEHEGGLLGVPSGFKDLDEYTAGFQRSDLIIIAGRPSMGKTALALNIARNAAVEHKLPVGIFSLEMAAFQLTHRMLCSEAKLDAHRVRTGKLADDDWQKLSICVGELYDAPIYIDDTAGISVLEIRAKARRLKSQYDLQLLIVDYLQMIEHHGLGRAENRQQEISQISRSLKQLAKELNIPVVALSQLSRAVEQRGEDRRPQLSDLRESGAIEQDADVVLFVYRPWIYTQRDEDEKKAEIIIGKQRNGPTGKVDLRFFREYSKFDDATRGDMGMEPVL
jgi:replicative DNA helicase